MSIRLATNSRGWGRRALASAAALAPAPAAGLAPAPVIRLALVIAVAVAFVAAVLPVQPVRAESSAAPTELEFELDWNETAELDLIGPASGWQLEFVGPASHGAVALGAEGTVSYTPEPGFTGEDAFVFTAVNAAGERIEGRVTLFVFAEAVFGPDLPASDAAGVADAGGAADAADAPDVADSADSPNVAGAGVAPGEVAAQGAEEDADAAASGLISGLNPWRHVIRIGLVAGAIALYFATRKKAPAA